MKIEIIAKLFVIITMSLTPISRDSMLIRRAQKLEEQRKNKINETVKEIYHNAVSVAESTEDSKYLYHLPGIHIQYGKYDFHRTNMAEILDGLRTLFPGCSVEHAMFVTQQKMLECIIVDWSPPAM